MLRIKYLLLIIILFPFISKAQSRFKPGYYINLKGDTIKGYINFHAPENNPNKLLFKIDTIRNTATTVSVLDVQYFVVDYNDRKYEYQRYVGPITTNIINIDYLPVGRDSSFKIDTVFLKIIQRGPNVILFSYSDNSKTRFFIAKKPNDTPEELIFRLYYNSAVANGIDRTVYENTWQKQLYKIASAHNLADEKFVDMINKSDFNERDILQIVSKINGISPGFAFKNNSTKARPLAIAFAAIAAAVIVIGMLVEFSSQH